MMCLVPEFHELLDVEGVDAPVSYGFVEGIQRFLTIPLHKGRKVLVAYLELPFPALRCQKFLPFVGPLSAAVIYSEYGDISNFSNPGQMLAFAGIEPGVNDSGTESHGGRMVKRGSSQLRYTLINCCLPLIRFDMTFATYYAKKRGEGKPHRVAITHVAKKLIRVIYALERQDIDFNVQKLH